jgi:hypothetical protein
VGIVTVFGKATTTELSFKASHPEQSSTTHLALILFPKSTIVSPTAIDAKDNNDMRNLLLSVHLQRKGSLALPMFNNWLQEKALLPTATPPKFVGLSNLMTTSFPFMLNIELVT